MNIFALSTGKGPSGIAILRLSGKDSLQISKLITKKNDIKSKEVNLCKCLSSFRILCTFSMAYICPLTVPGHVFIFPCQFWFVQSKSP